MKTNTQNNVASNTTQNNVATIYKITDIKGNLCKVIYNNVEYSGKLLNTSPTTHLHFSNLDVLLPATITTENNEQVYTKTTQYNGATNQEKFKQLLNILQGKTFIFDKSTQAHTTQRNNTNSNTLQYINNNESLKKQYDALKFDFDQTKAQFELAQKHFNDFMNDCKQKATQKQAQNTVEQLLQSGLITLDQIKALTQGGQK